MDEILILFRQVHFLLFVLFLADFTGCISLVQDLPGRVGSACGMHLFNPSGGTAPSSGPSASPCHEDAERDHRNRQYPPPSKRTARNFGSRHFSSPLRSVYVLFYSLSLGRRTPLEGYIFLQILWDGSISYQISLLGQLTNCRSRIAMLFLSCKCNVLPPDPV